MIDKICNYLTNKIRKQIPEFTDEKAEEINYGLQLLIGELPKTFIFILQEKTPYSSDKLSKYPCTSTTGVPLSPLPDVKSHREPIKSVILLGVVP